MTDAPPAPTPRARRAWAEAASAVGLASVLYYLRFGYSFGDGDHDDLLPELLRALDPALFATDPFVADRMAGVSVRGVFVGLLRGLSAVMPVGVAVGLVHVLVFAATAWGVFHLARTLLPARPLAALLAPTAALVFWVTWALGGNTLVYPYLVPEGIAWALVLPALAGVLKGRPLLPAVLTALAAWVHPVTGLGVALALGLFLVAGALPELRSRGLKALAGPVLFGVVFAVVAAPFVLPVVLGQAGEAAAGVPSGYALYVRLRLPHHLLPTAFGWTTWARFGLLALAGGFSLVWLARRGVLQHGGAVLRVVAVIAAVCLVATVGVVGLESLAVARVQAFKLTVLLAALFSIGICGGVAEALTLLPARLRRWMEVPPLYPVGTLAGVAVLALLVLTLAVRDVGRPGALYGPRAHARSDWGRVESWARTRTPPAALFTVPPTNASFRVGARRGVVATWKAHPFRSDAMRMWLARLRTVAPAPLPDLAHGDGRGYGVRLDSAYCANTTQAWRAIGRRTGAGFAVVEDGCGRPAGAPVFRSGGLAVYPLP